MQQLLPHKKNILRCELKDKLYNVQNILYKIVTTLQTLVQSQNWQVYRAQHENNYVLRTRHQVHGDAQKISSHTNHQMHNLQDNQYLQV